MTIHPAGKIKYTIEFTDREISELRKSHACYKQINKEWYRLVRKTANKEHRKLEKWIKKLEEAKKKLAIELTTLKQQAKESPNTPEVADVASA